MIFLFVLNCSCSKDSLKKIEVGGEAVIDKKELPGRKLEGWAASGPSPHSQQPEKLLCGLHGRVVPEKTL